MNLQVSRSPFRRLFAGNSLHTIVDKHSFRYAAECERLRIYRNNSTLAVLLIKRAQPNEDSLAAVERVLEGHLAPIDTAGYCIDDRIGVLLPDYSTDEARRLARCITDECDRQGCEVSVQIITYPDDPMDGAFDDVQPVGDQSIEEAPTAGAFFAVPVPLWKRTIDVVFGGAALALASPVILTGAALVKLTSEGTALFEQQRIGHGGRPFTIHKIRTMRMGAEGMIDALRHRSEQDGPAFKLRNDPRTLPVGRLLRKLSIDELPQLWNVVKGDMSLVGPRPLPTSESQRLSLWQRERLDAVPGITGLWQVSGRNNLDFEEWMKLDISYVRNQSLWLDIRILLKTIPAVLLCRGAS